jgi:hypothetical protein
MFFFNHFFLSTVMKINRYGRTYKNGILVTKFRVSPVVMCTHFRVDTYLDVCSMGWVTESNSHRSVTSVSLSLPQPSNRWERPSHRYRLEPDHRSCPY